MMPQHEGLSLELIVSPMNIGLKHVAAVYEGFHWCMRNGTFSFQPKTVSPIPKTNWSEWKVAKYRSDPPTRRSRP